MVGIESPRVPGVLSAGVDRPCPRWLLGIAQVNRLSSSGAPVEPAAVSEALAQLRSPNVAERLAAARLLSRISRHGDPEVIDALLGNTISSASFGWHDKPPTPPDTPCPALNSASAVQNVVVGGDVASLCSGVSMAGMRDKSSHVRAASTATAGALARDTGNLAVIAMLIELFEDEDWTVRSSALTALSCVAAEGGDDACIEQLLACLDGKAWSARVLAAQALGSIAPCGNEAVVSGLASALFDDDWAVQKAAATSIGIVAHVGDNKALDALLPLLEDADWRVRKTALLAIGNVAGHGCHRAIRAILLRLEDTCVSAPKALDQGNVGVRDVKLAAITVVQRLAAPNDTAVLQALQRFQAGLQLPQDDRLHMAAVQACRSIASAADTTGAVDAHACAWTPYDPSDSSSEDDEYDSDFDVAMSPEAAEALGSRVGERGPPITPSSAGQAEALSINAFRARRVGNGGNGARHAGEGGGGEHGHDPEGEIQGQEA